jgi:hypothetical protein
MQCAKRQSNTLRRRCLHSQACMLPVYTHTQLDLAMARRTSAGGFESDAEEECNAAQPGQQHRSPAVGQGPILVAPSASTINVCEMGDRTGKIDPGLKGAHFQGDSDAEPSEQCERPLQVWQSSQQEQRAALQVWLLRSGCCACTICNACHICCCCYYLLVCCCGSVPPLCTTIALCRQSGLSRMNGWMCTATKPA